MDDNVLRFPLERTRKANNLDDYTTDVSSMCVDNIMKILSDHNIDVTSYDAVRDAHVIRQLIVGLIQKQCHQKSYNTEALDEIYKTYFKG